MESAKINRSNLNFGKASSPKFSTKLNLVALMDIFTILVFFLLLNSGDAEQLENAKFVKLPDSSTKSAPHVEAMITIGDEKIWFNKEAVLTLEELTKSKQDVIQPLKEVLVAFKDGKPELTPFERENGLSVTILGDKGVSFDVLQYIMNTCTEADFRNVSLAVNRVAPQSFLISNEAPASSVQANTGG
ncbi:MAG: biopolymer transporter ExbD [Gammaproteobacteria bacterium]|nr:biopolymer transporter ExbD [Gammaproteobacteria bacterium]